MRSFGIPLRQAFKTDGHAVPYVVEKILDYLQANALDAEGLFRVPGELAQVNRLKQEMDEAPDLVDLSNYECNAIAEVLKKFFAELPEPLVPVLIDQHVKALFVGERRNRDEVMREIKFAVDSLSEESHALLERLTDFMAVLVSFASRNKMNLANLAACVAPSLKFTPAIFTYCIQYHSYFFGQASQQIPLELVDMASNVGGETGRSTPSAVVPPRSVILVSDSNYNSQTRTSPKGVSPKNAGPRDVAWPSITTSAEMLSGGSRDTPTRDISDVDTPRFDRENSLSLQERRPRDREKERDRDREKDKEKEREKEERDSESRHSRSRRKSRRASPNQQSSEELSGQETVGSVSDAITSYKSSRLRNIQDTKYESSSFAELGKSRNGNGAETDKERQKKKKYYKEEMAKLEKICAFWKNEAQTNKAKIDEMTDKNFDLESQLKKQKLKNKDLELDIEMLEHKLRRVGVDVARSETSADREDEREERKKEDGKARGGENASPPGANTSQPPNQISPRRRRSISVDPNDVLTGKNNGTGPVPVDAERIRRKDKRFSTYSPDSALHEHRSRSSSHIENKRSDITRRSTYSNPRRSELSQEKL